jgi:hypothetical protein
MEHAFYKKYLRTVLAGITGHPINRLEKLMP